MPHREGGLIAHKYKKIESQCERCSSKLELEFLPRTFLSQYIRQGYTISTEYPHDTQKILTAGFTRLIAAHSELGDHICVILGVIISFVIRKLGVFNVS